MRELASNRREFVRNLNISSLTLLLNDDFGKKITLASTWPLGKAVAQ